MDWRHIGDLLNAGEQVFSELKNLCVWNKTNGGMGTFYRSKHELIFVYKVGTAPHVNTFGLGETGRYRTNVWEYAGVNTFRAGRLEELELHPTVKPVDLVSDAIKDCSRRAGIVLDPFGGSGTTLIAAQKSGRKARLIEYDPSYCDVILRRFEAVTGTSAILAWTGQTFEETAVTRAPLEISAEPYSRSSATAAGKDVQTHSDDDAKIGPRPYRVPPAKFRFKKGTSGNLKGRTPKERALVPTKFGGQPGIGFEARIKTIAIEEAYRLITVREGDRIEKVPVIQAILRKVAVSAANGNTRAQRIYLDLVIGAEADRSAAAAEVLRAAVEGKEYWSGIFAEYDRRGIARPDPVPHPDDVVIDYETGEVRIKGPVMTEQKDAQEMALYNKRKFERDLEICIKAMEADPNNLELRRTHKELTKIVGWLRKGAPFAG